MNTPVFKPVKELSYNEAMAELEQILRTMQADNCDIDLLSVYTRRAAELIGECRGRLTSTEKELTEALADLQQKCSC